MGSSAVEETDVTLGAYEVEIIRPSFRALIEGRPAVIRLDPSALFKLAEDADDAALAHILNLQRPKIQTGARRMFEKGCYRELGDVLEITLTAQDID